MNHPKTTENVFMAVVLIAMLPLATTQSTGGTSSCTGEQYTDNNGLNFYTDCPPEAGSSHANQTYFWSAYEDSAEDCMNSCGVARPVCYAMTYSNGICYEYDDNLFPQNANGSRAIADKSQLATPDDDALECPYDPYSIQTVNGLDFQIICDQDFGGDGGDYCAYEEEPAKCPRHTDTLEECMQFCSEAHPLCKGVTWNADLLDGFGNCYLKAQPQGSSPDDYRHTHSAMVTQQFYEEVSTACPATSPYEAGGSNYTVSCNKGRVDTTNMTSVHSNSLDGCLGECSSHIGAGCQGVLFDMSMLEGYQNCYLLNDTGTRSPGGANMTFAALTTSNKGSTGGGGGNGRSSGGSKAWIAAPVIGAVVLIAAVIGGVIWWRRRRARRTATPEAWDGWDAPVEGPGAPMIKGHYADHPNIDQQPIQGGEKSGEPAVRHEMRDPNSERLWPPEMNA